METFSALLAFCAGNSPVPGEFPSQRPVTRSVDVSSDLRLNTQLYKQLWGWWFETPSCPLWCHHNVAGLSNALPCWVFRITFATSGMTELYSNAVSLPSLCDRKTKQNTVYLGCQQCDVIKKSNMHMMSCVHAWQNNNFISWALW